MWPNDIFNMCKLIYIELCGQVYMLRMEKQSEIHGFNQNVYHIYIYYVCVTVQTYYYYCCCCCSSCSCSCVYIYMVVPVVPAWGNYISEVS